MSLIANNERLSVEDLPKEKSSKGSMELNVEEGKNRKEESSQVNEKVPIDAAVVIRMLHSMGADEYEPRVINQLIEFIHRYASEVLIDAREYSGYAGKQSIDEDDVRLAVQSRLNHHYSQPPSRDLLLELAEKRNSIPLPLIPNDIGVYLPPTEYQLTAENMTIDLIKPSEPSNGLSATYHENTKSSMDQSSQPQEGSRNKSVAEKPITIKLSSNSPAATAISSSLPHSSSKPSIKSNIDVNSLMGGSFPKW